MRVFRVHLTNYQRRRKAMFFYSLKGGNTGSFISFVVVIITTHYEAVCFSFLIDYIITRPHCYTFIILDILTLYKNVQL